MYALILMIGLWSTNPDVPDGTQAVSSVPGFATLELCERALTKVKRNATFGDYKLRAFCVQTGEN